MDFVLKEKLIEIVRKYECLYNTKHKKYRNKNYKTLLWESIGADLEIEGRKAKEIWRSLRDGYVRYKKQIVGKTSSGRKYYKYTWSAQMSFLDETLELRPTSSNIPSQEAKDELSESRMSQASLLQPLSPKAEPSEADTSSPHSHTESPIQSPLPMHTRPSNAETPPSGIPNTASTIPLSDSMLVNVQSLPTSTNFSSTDRIDKILEYVLNRNRKRHEYDDVDHLFASYAKTFKKLSRRNQCVLKINLAKLFAEVEMSESDRDT